MPPRQGDATADQARGVRAWQYLKTPSKTGQSASPGAPRLKRSICVLYSAMLRGVTLLRKSTYSARRGGGEVARSERSEGYFFINFVYGLFSLSLSYFVRGEHRWQLRPHAGYTLSALAVRLRLLSRKLWHATHGVVMLMKARWCADSGTDVRRQHS